MAGWQTSRTVRRSFASASRRCWHSETRIACRSTAASSACSTPRQTPIAGGGIATSSGIFRSESIGFANWNYKSDNFGLVNRKGVADPSLVQAIGASAASAGQRNSVTLFDESGDVGAVQQPGSVASTGRGSFELSGSGANIWGVRDEFYFASTRVTGDLELVADVSFVDEPAARGAAETPPESSPQGGLDGPASREPDAPYADAMVHGDGLISLQYRAQKGAPTAEVQSP